MKSFLPLLGKTTIVLLINAHCITNCLAAKKIELNLTTGVNKTLYCEGKFKSSVSYGTSMAGKEANIDNNSGNTETSNIFELNNNKLIDKVDSGIYPDNIYTLCEKSQSEYVFASDCRLNEKEYLHNWYSENDHLNGKSSFEYDVIYINRLYLTVTYRIYNPTISEDAKHNGYMTTFESKLYCNIRKARI